MEKFHTIEKFQEHEKNEKSPKSMTKVQYFFYTPSLTQPLEGTS